ncbi:hypothetical protein [Streptomyces bluensis]|uniref:hypothetical protein n=1 Tax=Streptomyces bluensis TaxID=33897 RepID=UPI003331AA06
MKKPYWQPYWWRMSYRADGASQWSPMGPEPISQIPDGALENASLEAWAHALLAEVPHELDDFRGELLLECYEEPAPAAHTRPVYSCQVRLPGPALRSEADRRRRT